jgi:DNA-binding MarR family transcriptional regulator
MRPRTAPESGTAPGGEPLHLPKVHRPLDIYVYILAIMMSDCYSTTIRAATRKITGMYDAALAPAGVTIAQLALLRRLSDETPLSVEDLARAAELERSTATRNVRVLEKEGLVTIGKSETDRRAVTILLTPHGVDARRQSEPLWDEAQRQFEEKMGLEAANALRSLLQTV